MSGAPPVRLTIPATTLAAAVALPAVGFGLGVWGLLAAAGSDAGALLIVIEIAVAVGFVVGGAVGLWAILVHRVVRVEVHDDRLVERRLLGAATVHTFDGAPHVSVETEQRAGLRGGPVTIAWLRLDDGVAPVRCNPAAASYPLYPRRANRAVEAAADALRSRRSP